MSFLTNPLTIYGTVAAAILACLYLVFSLRLEMAHADNRHRGTAKNLNDTISAMQAEMEELRRTEHDRAAAVSAHDPGRGLNLQKRAEALRMYRRGSDADTVASALGLPKAEVMLLQKVQRVLADQAR